MLLGTFNKQPIERYDYDISYAEWLTSGDNVEYANVEVFPLTDDGLHIESVTVIDPRIKIWVTGGRNGGTYKGTITIGTADGRVKQDEFKIKVKDI